MTTSFSVPLDIDELLQQISICTGCYKDLIGMNHNFCQRCGGSVDTPSKIAVVSCRLCRDTKFRFASVTILGRYQDLLRETVLRIKQPNEQALARAIGILLSHLRFSLLAAKQSTIVVPIPMHWFRRFRRGMNSPEFLSQCLAETLNIPLITGGLRRRVNTKPQGELSETRRRQNLRHAFRSGWRRNFHGARILLVDDIMTTGVTCDEAAKVLLKQGASQVDVAILARSIPAGA